MPIPVNIVAFGGGNQLPPFHLYSAATTNATVVKPGPGRLYGWAITNTNAAARYIVFHDISASPVAGQGVLFKFGIPASGAANVFSEMGISFTNGIAITTVVNAVDTDATAVAAGDLVINLFYA